MLKRIHPAAGALALATIAGFWTATIWAETLGTTPQIVAVKQTILTGLWVLIPALALTGITGVRLTRNPRLPLVRTKMRRMQAAAALGLLVLVPCAILLARWAAAGQFGGAFLAVQGLELLAGATNLTLLELNLRDGLRLSGRLRRSA